MKTPGQVAFEGWSIALAIPPDKATQQWRDNCHIKGAWEASAQCVLAQTREEAPTIELVPRPTAEDPMQAWLRESEFRNITLIAWRPSLELWEIGITTGLSEWNAFGRTLESAWAQAMYYLAAGDAIYAEEYPVIAQQKARGE
jgi:hypothetical protein